MLGGNGFTDRQQIPLAVLEGSPVSCAMLHLPSVKVGRGRKEIPYSCLSEQSNIPLNTIPAGDGEGILSYSATGHSLAEAGKEKQNRGLFVTLAEGCRLSVA